VKVGTNRAGFDGVGSVRNDGPQGPAAAGVRKEQAAADQVRLSSGAQLATTAVGAVEQSPDIRQDKVARAKALLESGELGRDAHHLADAIIDRVIAND
jgi:flagellar biosynthesis anti-sigma factor FlgM